MCVRLHAARAVRTHMAMSMTPSALACCDMRMQVLGLQRSASQEEVKQAYRKLALRLHPDKNLGDEVRKGVKWAWLAGAREGRCMQQWSTGQGCALETWVVSLNMGIASWPAGALIGLSPSMHAAHHAGTATPQ